MAYPKGRSNALVRTSPSFPTKRLKLVGFTRSFIIGLSQSPILIYIIVGLRHILSIQLQISREIDSLLTVKNTILLKTLKRNNQGDSEGQSIEFTYVIDDFLSKNNFRFKL